MAEALQGDLGQCHQETKYSKATQSVYIHTDSQSFIYFVCPGPKLSYKARLTIYNTVWLIGTRDYAYLCFVRQQLSTACFIVLESTCPHAMTHQRERLYVGAATLAIATSANTKYPQTNIIILDGIINFRHVVHVHVCIVPAQQTTAGFVCVKS